MAPMLRISGCCSPSSARSLTSAAALTSAVSPLWCCHRERRPSARAPSSAACTKEACDFRDSRQVLADSGFAVLGISPDSPAKLAKFREREGLTFPLLSDPDKTVHEAYGAYGEKMLYGKKSVGVIRSTFVIGADGAIERADYGVKATGHVARLRKDLCLAS